jgi:hypothetical protein
MEIDPSRFAKKPQIEVPEDILDDVHKVIPPIYYLEDVENGKSVLMTMAFQMFGNNYGEIWPIEDTNFVKIDIMRKKLFNVVKESLDVMVHHGQKILDSDGNIDIEKMNEQEALRYKYDKFWKEKVAAFNKLVKIAPITRKKAEKLGLLN